MTFGFPEKMPVFAGMFQMLIGFREDDMRCIVRYAWSKKSNDQQ